MLTKSPAFTFAVVMILGLGIGVNTALFSVLNAIVFRPLPVEQADQLMRLYSSDASGADFGTSAYPDFADWRAQNRSFRTMAAFDDVALNLSADGQTERLNGEMVSGDYFQLLGVRPLLGRAFLPEEDRTPGTHPVAMVSEDLWRARSGSDPGLLGRAIVLNSVTFTVVGIVPGEFRGVQLGSRPLVWVPMMMQAVARPRSQDLLRERGSRWMNVIGRLKSGVTLEQADADLDAIARNLAETYPRTNEGYLGVRIFPAQYALLWPSERTRVLRFVGMLFGVVGLVLLIACANVANLLLARGVQRRREIAVRLALGASRRRLAQLVMSESLLLAGLGGLLGMLVAVWTSDLLLSLVPPTVELSLQLSLDWRVLGFALGVSLLTGCIFGIAPAVNSSRASVQTALKNEPLGLGRAWFRQGLVTVQIALSLVLLVGAGLLLRSMANARLIDPGFNPDGVLIGATDLRLSRYSEERGRVFYTQLLERLRSAPGVESAALADIVPLGLAGSRSTLTVSGYQPAKGEDMNVDGNVISPDYFRTLQIPVLHGRVFGEQDRAGTERVAIVNEAFASRFWPGQEPIGRRFRDGGPQEPEIVVVGVVKNGKYRTYGERQRGMYYTALWQTFVPNMNVLVRTHGEPMAIAPVARRVVQELDANLPLIGVRTLREHAGTTLFPVRTASALMTAFAGLALTLASVGLYAVMAFSVAQRTKEIGIRMALGAQHVDVVGLVLRQGMAVTAVGLVAGLAAAAGLAKFTTSLLYGVSPNDPATFVILAALMALVSLAACMIPARRAAGVDPMVALRHE